LDRDFGSSWIITRRPQLSSLAWPFFISTVSLQPMNTFSASVRTTFSPDSTKNFFGHVEIAGIGRGGLGAGADQHLLEQIDFTDIGCSGGHRSTVFGIVDDHLARLQYGITLQHPDIAGEGRLTGFLVDLEQIALDLDRLIARKRKAGHPAFTGLRLGGGPGSITSRGKDREARPSPA
jgi:hypothetical protein